MTVTMQKPPPSVEQSHAGPVVVDTLVPAKPVREGTAPLVYLLPGSGTVRIVDKTSGRELSTMPAESRSIIRIDDFAGVSLGKQTLLPGPLPAGHEYEIYLSTGSESAVEHTRSAPGR